MWRAGLFGGPVVLTACLAGAVAHADDDRLTNAPDPTSAATAPVPWLLGDWGGARTRLQNQGIDSQFGYTGEFAYNATGGIKSEATYTDQYSAGMTLDLNRLIGIPDAQFQATITERTGRNLSDDAQLGTLQQVQEVFGRGQTIRLTDFWYEQKYADGLIDWKVGRMPFSEDFAAFSCDFQNLMFCGSAPGNIVGNYIWDAPISQWATRVKLALNGFGYFQVGIYDVNPKYLGVQDQVLPVFFPGSTGALVPVELAWLPKFGNDALSGSYKFGAWYDTSTADDVVDDINGNPFTLTGLPPLQRRGRYGGYINFQQQMTSSLSLFLNVVMADRRTATIDRQIAGGLIYTGPLSWRPNDDVALAVGTTHVNSRMANVETLQNTEGLGSEYTFEVDYTFRPDNGLLFRPNIQYVHHPGGTSQNHDVLVFGLKTSANF
jgi:porin